MYMHCNDEINDVTFASLLNIEGTHYSAHIVPPVRPNLTTNGPLSPDTASNITKFSGIIVQPGCTVNLGFVMLYFNIAGRVFAGRRVRQNYQPANLYSFELVELQVCTTGKFQHSLLPVAEVLGYIHSLRKIWDLKFHTGMRALSPVGDTPGPGVFAEYFRRTLGPWDVSTRQVGLTGRHLGIVTS
jgi:hypothetical protein